MFWGLVIKPRRTYSQVVTKTFHVSQATLDVSSCTNSNTDVKLIVKIEPFNHEYILCVLNKSQAVQAPLDLIFSRGDEISFHCIGGIVHLTGYVVNNTPHISEVKNVSKDDTDYEGNDEDSEGVYDFEGNKIE